jgi:hypothetical protein
VNDEEIERRMAAQTAEFDKVENLFESYLAMCAVAVVDDEYPKVRHAYEAAINGLIAAMRANGRF